MFKLLPVLLILVSCGSTQVQSVHKTSKYAPTGYKQKGIVKYLNQGADFIIEKRRESAFRDMYAAYGGPDYEILSESNKPEFTHVNGNPLTGGIDVSNTNYVYIEFKCLDRKPAEAGEQAAPRPRVKNCGAIGGLFGC